MFHWLIEAPRAARFDINIRLAALFDTSNILISQPNKTIYLLDLSPCPLLSCSKLEGYRQLKLLRKAQIFDFSRLKQELFCLRKPIKLA